MLCWQLFLLLNFTTSEVNTRIEHDNWATQTDSCKLTNQMELKQILFQFQQI